MASDAPLFAAPSLLPRLSFTQGVLLGQLSMVVLAVLFLRYVVFEDPDAAREERAQKLRDDPLAGRSHRQKQRQRARTRTGEGKKSTSTSASPPTLPESAASILNSIAYDLSSHSPESLDWLNVLIAQLLSSYRMLAANHLAGGARGLIEDALNRKVRPDATAVEPGSSAGLIGLDEIEVEEVELGEGFPQLSNARVRPSGNDGEGLRVELDLDYSDKVSLSLSTRVVMNFPRPRFAVLPVSLSLTLQRFSGTVTIELPTPSVNSPNSSPVKSAPSLTPHEHPSIHLSLHPDFTLDLSTSSLLGSRAKLEDVPKVEQLLIARIRAVIQDRLVWPGRVEIGLPGIHPRHSKKHATDISGGGEDFAVDADGQVIDDWTVVDRPHPLACDNESLPPSFSISDFKHRNADSDSEAEGETDDYVPKPGPASRVAARRTNPSKPSSDPFFSTSTSALLQDDSLGSSAHSTPSAETPSVDFSDPSGPTISLHPKIRPRSHQLSASQGQNEASKVRELNVENLKFLDQTFRAEAGGGGGGPARLPPSPTESFPGYFPGAGSRGGVTGGLGTAVGFNSAGGTRYRGVGGVGLSSR
ncbi:hypothetical protein JCM11491_006170 [Sporobolomyces phaffii]